MGRISKSLALIGAFAQMTAAAQARSAGELDHPFAAVSQSRLESGPDAEPGPSPVARVSVSRAPDLVGQPVYYSQSKGLGIAGMVAISQRRLPAGSVFSVALRPALAAPSRGSSLLAAGPRIMPASMPVAAYGITSGFGMRQHPVLGVWRSHAGLDLAASYGSPIVATSDGMVGTAGWQGGYGLLVSLDHGGGLQTRYGHMSRLAVEPGQQVRKGSVIGYVGSSGLATGPHLHYEIRLNGAPIDPATHIGGR